MQSLYNGVRFGFTGPSPRNIMKIDQGATPMVVSMMQRGLLVDLDHFHQMEKTLSDDMEQATEEVRDLTGYYINLASGPQVSDLLFKKLGLKQARLRMTPKGDRESVENDILVAIQHDHPCVPKILDYKEYDKLRGTYVVPMPKLAKRTKLGQWRLLPNLGMTRVPSGRFNCKAPNLLAMPNRSQRGRDVCLGFITDEKWVYLSCDFSQIEPRITAHRSQDKNLIRVYENDEDIYSDFAINAFKLADKRYRDAQTLEWKYPGVDKKEHRFPSKTCILSAIYRISPGGLLEKMPILCANCGWKQDSGEKHLCASFSPFWTEQKCEQILNSFFFTYPGIVEMWKRDDNYVRRHAYICNDFGRLQHITAVRSVLKWVVSTALREAGNLPIQGNAGECLKLAMAEIQDILIATGMLGEIIHPLLPVHDELLFECLESEAEELGQIVSTVFENVVKLRVPIKAGVAVSNSWGALAK